MFIGTTIKEGFEDPTKKYPDSVFIEVGDVFINLDDIPKYCDRIKDTLPANETIELVLHVDSKVDESFTKRVLEKVPATIQTYKAVNKGGQLGVSKITRD